ncbi:MAG: hypothetical protein QNJ36_17135, partial [Calothrix sp. MO_167.B42]|nr:hypothetical protein [Calothrix sp. MO_167.B42]
MSGLPRHYILAIAFFTTGRSLECSGVANLTIEGKHTAMNCFGAITNWSVPNTPISYTPYV